MSNRKETCLVVAAAVAVVFVFLSLLVQAGYRALVEADPAWAMVSGFPAALTLGQAMAISLVLLIVGWGLWGAGRLARGG